MTVTVDGQQYEWMVPVEQFPRILALPQFPMPGILRGVTPSQVWDYVNIRARMHNPPVIKGAEDVKFEVNMNMNPREFTRLLAKIAHGLAVVRYGVDGFQPFLTKHIRDDDPTAPHIVGSKDSIEPVLKNTLHELSIGTKTSNQGDRIIIVNVRLFAQEPTPTYVIVTGIAKAELRTMPKRIGGEKGTGTYFLDSDEI